MPYLWGSRTWGPGLWGGQDNPPVFDDLTTYYMNLLIRQYINRPKAAGTVGVMAREFVAGSLVADLADAFDLIAINTGGTAYPLPAVPVFVKTAGVSAPYDSVVPDFDDLTMYYTNLLIKQYWGKPKALGTVGVLVREAVASGIFATVREGFDLS